MAESGIGFSGALRPDGRVLEGVHCRLERLDPARHSDDLWASVENHDDLWTFLGYGPFAGKKDFVNWLNERAGLADPFYYALVDRHSERALGVLALMEIRPDSGVIEVGHIVFSPLLQRTPAATEALHLCGRHVFVDLGYRRFEWKCNNSNEASKRAALRFGFVAEGVFRQHMVVKGRNRDTAWFSIIDCEWPVNDRAFERWLSAGNFGPRGEQKIALSTINARDLEVGSLKLRRLSITERPLVERFQQEAYARNRDILGAEPIPLKWDYETIFHETEVWGAEDKGQLVGVLILRPRENDLYLESVATRPSAQGAGYGNALLMATEFRARDWGYKIIRLVTGEALTRNTDWYLRKDFHVEDIERLADRSLVHMVRHLRD